MTKEQEEGMKFLKMIYGIMLENEINADIDHLVDLKDEILSLVVEHLIHLRGVSVELGVLARLNALVLGVAVPLAGSPAPLAHLLGLLPLRRLHPSLLVSYILMYATKTAPSSNFSWK